MSTTDDMTDPVAPAPPPGLKELNALIDSLNNLIISYLNLFDIYQPLREKLSSKLSSGFFNLSQANYASPGHRRYGQDYFDDRMKALRGVNVIPTPHQQEQSQSQPHPKFEVKEFLPSSPPTSTPTQTQEEEEDSGGLRRRKAHLHNTNEDANTTEDKEKEEVNGYNNNNNNYEVEEEERKPLSAEKLRDPIRWFGVLVPPSLRTAQRDFMGSLDDITTMSTLLKEMDRHEEGIRELRRKIKAAKEELGDKFVQYKWKTATKSNNGGGGFDVGKGRK